MCSYSRGIKCGIRDFIGRSEKKIGRGMEIMAARMAAQRRGFPDETEIERCLLFSTFAWPTSSIQYTKIQIDCSHSLFPHQQVLLGSCLLAGGHYSGQQVDSGNGKRRSLNWERALHTSQPYQLFL